MGNVNERIDRIGWTRVYDSLNKSGYALTGALLNPSQCEELSALYDRRENFRSRIEMARFRFGVGEYKYFAMPLPAPVQELRESLYPRLAPIAKEWMEVLGAGAPFPPSLAEFLALCDHAGQSKPTPLILRYDAGGYNCMHQDIYGDVVFPIQLTCVLSRRETDYTGGEFLLVEQRPRAQSRAEAVTLEQGEGILFATRYRPAKGSRGYYRMNVRHGVSTIRSGRRFSLGIIFHNAR